MTAKAPPARTSKPSTRKVPASAAPPAADKSTVVLRRFRVIFNAVKTHFRQVEKEVGIGGAQLWALSEIRDRPGIGVGDLGRAMDVHQSTASNLVKLLIERNLVVGVKDANDRRAVGLRLLPAGAKLLKRAPGPFSGVLPEALANLDPKVLARLDRDLALVVVALAADDSATVIPLGQS